MKKNKKAMSLIVVMGIVLISSLLALSLMWLIFPFARSVIWIENSSRAYYQANSWIEQWLLKVKKIYSPENQNNSNLPEVKNGTDSFWYKEKTIYLWNNEPAPGKWNSVDKNFNILAVWEPIQMEFDWTLEWVDLYIRPPRFDWITAKILSQDWEYAKKNLLSLTLTSIDWSSYFTYPNPKNSETFFTSIKINNWAKWEGWNSTSFWNAIWLFYKNWKTTEKDFLESMREICAKKCIYKLSLVNDLISAENTKILLPYLEWKIVSRTKTIKLRYSEVNSEWRANWYVRNLNVRSPQNTVNEAFDFAVFQ